MRKVWPYLIILSVCWAPCRVVTAQPTSSPSGRFQLVSVAAGQQSGVFLLDTATGCTWQLGAHPENQAPHIYRDGCGKPALELGERCPTKISPENR